MEAEAAHKFYKFVTENLPNLLAAHPTEESAVKALMAAYKESQKPEKTEK